MDKKLFLICFRLVLLLGFSTQVLAVAIDVKVIDKSNAPLADLVVYLQPEQALALPKSEHVVEVGQFDRAFTPYISVMQRGNSVNFHNKDDITHHIYSPVGGNKFSFKIKAGESRLKDDFSQTGEIAMGCNIHDWMSGYLLVLDTPYFAKTDANGQLSLDIKHKGRYQLVVWHPQLDVADNRQMQIIDIQDNNAFTITLAHELLNISEQKNEEDFDFLSDY